MGGAQWLDGVLVTRHRILNFTKLTSQKRYLLLVF